MYNWSQNVWCYANGSMSLFTTVLMISLNLFSDIDKAIPHHPVFLWNCPHGSHSTISLEHNPKYLMPQTQNIGLYFHSTLRMTMNATRKYTEKELRQDKYLWTFCFTAGKARFLKKWYSLSQEPSSAKFIPCTWLVFRPQPHTGTLLEDQLTRITFPSKDTFLASWSSVLD